MRLLKVYLNVYDFLSINGCLAAIGLGGYHTGIEIKYRFPHSVTSSSATALYLPIPSRQA
jgi:hypothetical protein